jgi:exodeoxyribonuclease VII large subunit
MLNVIKSVSEITNEIKNLLENKIGFVSIEGEISNYKPHYSGHKYFTLKDEFAQINCTMWKSRPINFNLVDGQKVIITGAINVYPPRGTYQIDVLTIVPAGVGDLFQAFEMLKQKLETLGYFNQERKKEIPDFIMNIGVSTSPTGAAVQDIISTINRRLPCANIYFRPTIVQGDSASADIVNAIQELSNYPLDVIIVGRGGGAIEDLWSYNTEEVATAIYNCPIPIISAVGHETDFTIADFVADIRAATPTAAAELSTPTQLYEILATIDNYATDMTDNIYQQINNINNTLASFNMEQFNRDLMNKINYSYEKIDTFTDTINKNINFTIKTKLAEINNIENNLKALSPFAPLSRGYCLLQKDGKTISNDTSLSEIKTFELIRKNEKIIAKFDKICVK